MIDEWGFGLAPLKAEGSSLAATDVVARTIADHMDYALQAKAEPKLEGWFVGKVRSEMYEGGAWASTDLISKLVHEQLTALPVKGD